MSTSFSVQPVPPDTRQWVVLAVDDRPDNLMIVQKALHFHGAAVHVAKSAQEGLQLLQTLQPSFLLLDLSMPQMDGWQMLQVLRNTPDLAKIPVIALTAHAMIDDRERVLAAGFNGYITKPFDIFALVHQIRSMICSPTEPTDKS